MGKQLYWVAYSTIRSRKVSIKYRYWGDIPGIKRLFSKESERHQKRELVIFVTPHILKQGERMEMAKKEKHFKQIEKAKKIKERSISLMFSHFFQF